MVVDDAPVSLPTPHSMIYSIVPLPKERDEVGDLTCDSFTFLTPTSPVDQVEKESDSVDEMQTSARKVSKRNITRLSKNTLVFTMDFFKGVMCIFSVRDMFYYLFTQLFVALKTGGTSPFT